MLEEAKVGVLAASATAARLGWAIFHAIERIPKFAFKRAGLTPAEPLTDLAAPVGPERDHIRGCEDAAVTLLEYRDYECPYCGRAEEVIRELLANFGGDLRYVWRYLPLNDVHAHAQLAAEAAAAAAAQGRTWPMQRSSSPIRTSSLISSATQPSSASTSSASRTTSASAGTRPASSRTSTAPT
jgi:hypothetical protein